MRHAGSVQSGRLLTAAALAACLAAGILSSIAAADGWRHYGGSLQGDRYAAPSAITPTSVHGLAPAWVYRTGDATDGDEFDGARSRLRVTPILVGGKLIGSTGFNRVFALDPATGAELWTFDPKVSFSRSYSEMFTSRGVAAWQGPPTLPDHCRSRIFLGTLDARLIALDVDTGQRCTEFGERGVVDLSAGIRGYRKRDYSVTSPATVVGDLVIVGSAIGDNGAAHVEPGVVRAYSARNGTLAWSWDPLPRSKDHPGAAGWTDVEGNLTGGANVWSVMAADPARDLVFLPTTSPSPDFYGGKRPGDNAFANSVVALRASSGEFVWGFQTVRHDLWDYDLAAQPLLFDHRAADGTSRPAVAQATKTGFVFVLDRETGEPLHPVEERPVPRSDVPGEQAARSQPFAKLRLHATDARPLRIWNRSAAHRAACERYLAGVRYEGIYTPPSLEGTLMFPGNPGGTNWGSMAYDHASRIGYLTVSRLPTVVKLIPRNQYRAAARRGTLNGKRAEFTEQHGTPYGMARFEPLHHGVQCLEGPWATLAAVDLDRGVLLWEQPLGSLAWAKVGPEAAQWGSFAAGGPLVTAGGVVFIGTQDGNSLYAYDGGNGNLSNELAIMTITSPAKTGGGSILMYASKFE